MNRIVSINDTDCVLILTFASSKQKRGAAGQISLAMLENKADAGQGNRQVK